MAIKLACMPQTSFIVVICCSNRKLARVSIFLSVETRAGFIVLSRWFTVKKHCCKSSSKKRIYLG